MDMPTGWIPIVRAPLPDLESAPFRASDRAINGGKAKAALADAVETSHMAKCIDREVRVNFRESSIKKAKDERRVHHDSPCFCNDCDHGRRMHFGCGGTAGGIRDVRNVSMSVGEGNAEGARELCGHSDEGKHADGLRRKRRVRGCRRCMSPRHPPAWVSTASALGMRIGEATNPRPIVSIPSDGDRVLGQAGPETSARRLQSTLSRNGGTSSLGIHAKNISTCGKTLGCEVLYLRARLCEQTGLVWRCFPCVAMFGVLGRCLAMFGAIFGISNRAWFWHSGGGTIMQSLIEERQVRLLGHNCRRCQRQAASLVGMRRGFCQRASVRHTCRPTERPMGGDLSRNLASPSCCHGLGRPVYRNSTDAGGAHCPQRARPLAP